MIHLRLHVCSAAEIQRTARFTAYVEFTGSVDLSTLSAFVTLAAESGAMPAVCVAIERHEQAS